MTRYVKRPVEAEQFNGSAGMAIDYGLTPITYANGKRKYFIGAPDDPREIKKGDWIIPDSHGNHYAVTDKEFRNTYSPIDVIEEFLGKPYSYSKILDMAVRLSTIRLLATAAHNEYQVNNGNLELNDKLLKRFVSDMLEASTAKKRGGNNG